MNADHDRAPRSPRAKHAAPGKAAAPPRASRATGARAPVGGETSRDVLRNGALMNFDVPENPDGVDLAMLLVACSDACSDLGDVRVDCDVELPPVRGQANALQRLFLEILDSAFEAGARGIVARVDADGHAAACVEFRDDRSRRSRSRRAIKPFATSRPEKRNGAGLAIAARIATAYEGAMGLGGASEGAVCWVRLPFADAA